MVGVACICSIVNVLKYFELFIKKLNTEEIKKIQVHLKYTDPSDLKMHSD